jgi:hypothetical protein
VIPADLEKLLGGYATGTLTAEERQALYEAALEDQRLFDALSREEALRGLLSDPAARARLLAALDRQPEPWYRFAWLSMPVRALAATAALAICMVAGYRAWHSRSHPAATEVAVLRPATTPPAPPMITLDGPASIAAPVAKKLQPVARDFASNSDAVRPSPARSRALEPPQPKVGAVAGIAGNLRASGPLPEPSAPPAPAAAPAMAKGVEMGRRQEPAQAEAQANRLQSQSADSLVVQGQDAASGASRSSGYPFAPAPLLDLKESVANPLRWTVLRRNAGGSFEPIGPADLRAGDIIELRLESTLEGEVSLSEAAADLADSPVLLAATHIVPGQSLVTAPIAPSKRGPRVFTLHLTGIQPVSTVVRLNYQ